MRLLIGFCLCCFACTGTYGESTYLFRYAHSQTEQHPRSVSMRFFERELEARSGGRIEVEVYFSSVLGREREIMDMVTTGALQGTRGALFTDANPRYTLFMMPFLVRDWAQARRLMYSDFTREINAAAAANGFHIPASGISQGFRAHTNNIRPVASPGDLKGLKMRVPPQEVYLLTAQAFGTNPQDIPYSEAYQAIKTGVVDGQDNAPSNIWEYKVYEVQKYLTITNYATGPDPMIVNLAWYEGLPSDLKEVFDQVSVETIRFSDDMNEQSEQDYIARLSSVLETTVVDAPGLEQFAELARPVYQHFIDKGVFSWGDVERARRIARGDDQDAATNAHLPVVPGTDRR